MVPTIEAKVETSIVRSDPLPNDIFKRWMSVGHEGREPFSVQILDEQVVYHSENGKDGSTAIVRQFIRGHYDLPITANWKRHWGWQDAESIRELMRYNLPMPDGTFETRTREIDVSNKNYRFD